MNYQKSGLLLQARRKDLNLTQKELADRIGVSDKTISKWECGKGLPDLEILSELCRVLGITVNDYVSGEIITSDAYSAAAEETIMKLLEENETNGKKGLFVQIVCGILAAVLGIFLLLITNFGVTWKTGAWYLDPLTLGIEFLCLAACLLLSGKLAKGETEIVAFCTKAAIPVGSFLSVFQIANALNSSMDALAAYGAVAVGCLPLLYALGITVLLLIIAK